MSLSPTTPERSESDRNASSTEEPESESGNNPRPNRLSLTLKHAREEELKKGKAVTQQLAMYDSLLDARIRLQKCITSMNRLPDSAEVPLYLANSGSRDTADGFLCEALELSMDLIELQEKLMTSNELQERTSRKRKKIDDRPPADCDWEEKLHESMRQFTQFESIYHPTLLSTLQKWSNKVLAIAPSALLPSNRTKFSRTNVTQARSAVQLVDEAILEREKLVLRTRTRRSTAARLGRNHNQDMAATADSSGDIDLGADVFDDTDFYQTLLRDVVEGRAGGTSSGDLDAFAVDWRVAQKQGKASKAVDTRASKGRKLRFEVHEKLQNFMAPSPPPGSCSWHEEQIDELFASLLGKGFSIKVNDFNVMSGRRDVELDIGDAPWGMLGVF